MGVRPNQHSEPSEDELRAMLEEREQAQTADRRRLARICTCILAVIFAALAVAALSSADFREAVTQLFREPASEASPRPQPVKPPGAQESVEDELKRTANDVTAGPLVSPDGKVISKEDIGFAMELLNFAQGPPSHQEPPAEKARKDP